MTCMPMPAAAGRGADDAARTFAVASTTSHQRVRRERVDVRLLEPGRWPEWTALADQLETSPFIRPGWLVPWHGTFGRGPLIVLGAFVRGELTGALPMQVQRGVLRSPTNWHSPEFSVLAATDDVANGLLAAAVARSGRRLDFSFIDAATASALQSAADAADQPIIARIAQRSPYLEVGKSFTAYESSLSRNHRQDVRRRIRRLAEAGEVSLTVYEELDGALLDKLFQIEASGWKGRQGTAIASQSSTRLFYQKVAQWAAAHGWLRLVFLCVDDRPVAGDLAVRWAGTEYLLKTGIDEAYANFSPGKVLRRSVVERAFADGLQTYDFLGSEADWKRAWTRSTRDHWHVQVFRRGRLMSSVDHIASRYGRPLARTIVAGTKRLASSSSPPPH